MESLIKSASYIEIISYYKLKIPSIDKFNSDSAALKPVAEKCNKPLWFSREIMFVHDREMIQRLELRLSPPLEAGYL